MEGFRRILYDEYTDLACERRRADLDIEGVDFEEVHFGDMRIESIRIRSERGADLLGAPIGRYDTLHAPSLETLDDLTREGSCEVLSERIGNIAEEIAPRAERILIVGLGNEELTPDAVGVLSARGVRATLHIKREDPDTFSALGCREIAVLTPGVTARTGLETAEFLEATVKSIRPDLVLVIDALAARSTDRLGKTVQVASTGLAPGHGIGNRRAPIDSEHIGVPVMSIGVPTVTDARAFFEEHAERAGFLSRVYPEQETPLFVCPKDIGGIVSMAASIVSESINRAFGIVF